MKTIILTQKIQCEFLGVLKDNNVKNWYDDNRTFMNNIAQLLKKVNVPRSDQRKEKLSEFICNSFLLLFTVLWHPEEDKLQVEALAFQDVQQLLLELVQHDQKAQWNDFYNDYEAYFDYVIYLARSQKIVDIQVEGKDRRKYSRFNDAATFRNPISQWSCCSTFTKEDNSRPTHKPNNETIIKQPGHILSNFPENDYIPNEITEREEPGKYNQQLRIISSPKCSQREKIQKDYIGVTKVERPKVHRNLSDVSNASSTWSSQRNGLDQSFQRKLNAQNEKFAEELREMREKRERLNREAEEEMRKFREESRKRILFFFNCIQLRIRWEEQEEEWGDWLKSVRDPVVKVKQQFIYFGVNRQKNDEKENMSEVTYLHKYVQNAYDKLVDDFGTLTTLSDKYENKLFLKVIQKKISIVATKLCALMEELEKFQNDNSFYSRIRILESEIDRMDIPTTSKLRLICETASSDDYKFVVPPRQPRSNCPITEI